MKAEAYMQGEVLCIRQKEPQASAWVRYNIHTGEMKGGGYGSLLHHLFDRVETVCRWLRADAVIEQKLSH
jgi:hypothetical protein